MSLMEACGTSEHSLCNNTRQTENKAGEVFNERVGDTT